MFRLKYKKPSSSEINCNCLHTLHHESSSQRGISTEDTEGKQRYSSTHSQPRPQKGVDDYCHVPTPFTSQVESWYWVGSRIGLRFSNPGPSSPQQVAIPTEISRPPCARVLHTFCGLLFVLGEVLFLLFLSVFVCSICKLVRVTIFGSRWV